MRPEDDGGWGRDGIIPTNMLYIYRPDGPKERLFVTTTGKTHEGRLFLHELCTGNRVSYTVAHVNALLTRKENVENIKERIVELIPKLSASQKALLAKEITPEALEVVRSINEKTAEMLEQQQSVVRTGRIAEFSQPSLLPR